MKKLLSAILITAILVGALLGCGKQHESDDAKPQAQTAVNNGTEAAFAKMDKEFNLKQAPTNSNPLSDIRIRRALDLAIDKTAIVKSLLKGKGTEADALMPNGDWKSKNLCVYEYNPELARKLLKEAKWDPNYTLDVVYYYGDQMTVDLMAAIQQYLAQVGVKMTARKLEGDLASQLWTKPADSLNGPSAVKWDLAYAAVSALAPHDYYSRFRSGASSNSHTPADSELDKLILATEATVDVKKQQAAFKDLERYENAVLPEIPLYYQKVFIAQSDKVDRKGAPYGNEQYNYDWKINNWEVKPDATGKKILRTNGGPQQFFETPFFNPGFLMSTKVLYDHLLVADEKLGVTGGQLAKIFTVSKDGKTIEFILKDNIFWHDGSPITAQDVKWTFEYASKVTALNPVFGTSISSLDGYKDFKEGRAKDIRGIRIDGKKIIFQYTKADPNALLTFTQLPPLPEKYFQNVDPLKFQQAEYFQKPIGSGPFKIESVKMDNYAIFVPFEKYHDGIAKIDRIEMYPSGESDPNFVKNAAAGKLDYGYTKSIEDVLALEKMSYIKLTAVENRYTRFIYINKFPKK